MTTPAPTPTQTQLENIGMFTKKDPLVVWAGWVAHTKQFGPINLIVYTMHYACYLN